MSTLNLSNGPEWKNLVENYEDFQNELNNASEGIEFLKQLWTDFHQYEVDKVLRMFLIAATRGPEFVPNLPVLRFSNR